MNRTVVIAKHPRLDTTVELSIVDEENREYAHETFNGDKIQVAAKKAIEYAERTYPNIPIKVRDVQFSDGV